MKVEWSKSSNTLGLHHCHLGNQVIIVRIRIIIMAVMSECVCCVLLCVGSFLFSRRRHLMKIGNDDGDYDYESDSDGDGSDDKSEHELLHISQSIACLAIMIDSDKCYD